MTWSRRSPRSWRRAEQEAAEAAKKEALGKAKDALELAASKVVVPKSPAGYANFLSAVKEAEAALAGGAGLPQELLEAHAKEILLVQSTPGGFFHC